MYNKDKAEAEIAFLMEMRKNWDSYRDKQDSGSYCEDASSEYLRACRIRRGVQKLLEELIKL